jgi:hypothetical protein
VTWQVDLTPTIRSDLVGLDQTARDALIDLLVEWTTDGPPRGESRTMMEITFYEVPVADRYLLAYVIDDNRQRFALLWLRRKPGS